MRLTKFQTHSPLFVCLMRLMLQSIKVFFWHSLHLHMFCIVSNFRTTMSNLLLTPEQRNRFLQSQCRITFGCWLLCVLIYPLVFRISHMVVLGNFLLTALTQMQPWPFVCLEDAELFSSTGLSPLYSPWGLLEMFQLGSKHWKRLPIFSAANVSSRELLLLSKTVCRLEVANTASLEGDGESLLCPKFASFFQVIG